MYCTARTNVSPTAHTTESKAPQHKSRTAHIGMSHEPRIQEYVMHCTAHTNASPTTHTKRSKTLQNTSRTAHIEIIHEWVLHCTAHTNASRTAHQQHIPKSPKHRSMSHELCIHRFTWAMVEVAQLNLSTFCSQNLNLFFCENDLFWEKHNAQRMLLIWLQNSSVTHDY